MKFSIAWIVVLTFGLASFSTIAEGKIQNGKASYYWRAQPTASGERFNPSHLTAAHKSLPFGTMVKVTNLRNGKTVTVRINDRGPYKPGRIIDVSLAAAQQLGMTKVGIVPVKIERIALTAAVLPLPAPTLPAEIDAPTAALPAIIPPTIAGYVQNLFAVRPRADMSRTPAELKSFLKQVQSTCGEVTVVSGLRPGARVRGSGRVSLHASGRAIDYQIKDTSCALRVAKGWPGGHSTDYARVNHFHISWAPGSGEWKRRFVHYGSKKVRYAKRWKSKHRYAYRHSRKWRG